MMQVLQSIVHRNLESKESSNRRFRKNTHRWPESFSGHLCLIDSYMKTKQKIESLILILFGLFLIIESVKLLDMNSLALSAGLFPLILGVLIVLFSFVLFLQAQKLDDSIETKKLERASLIKCAFMTVNCVVYVALMKYITFLPATLVFVAVASYLVGERKWWKILLLSVAGSIFIFSAFKYGLHVYLP